MSLCVFVCIFVCVCVFVCMCVCIQASERMRVEVLSLSLRPECGVARDSGVVRLFVEFSLLDLPTEETPLSLPKPPPGKSINYNYSKGERLRH